MIRRFQSEFARTILLAAFVICLTTACSAQAQVRFRLPLAADTTTHYYYDHDPTSGRQDWKCGTATYDGHRGTDFSGGPRGKAIYAAASGTLEYKIDGFGDGYIGNNDGGGFGNYVRLGHADGFRTYYGHMENGTVAAKSVGSAIACGELIGGVGTSGNSSGLHLHFEPRKWNGSSYVADDPFAGNCSGPTSWWVNQGTGTPTTNCTSNLPDAPSTLVATALSTNQIGLNWTDNATNETGFRIERAQSPGGPWSLVATAGLNVTTYTNSGLLHSSTYFFRVRAYHANGNSTYSNPAHATTHNSAPSLSAIADKTVNAGGSLNFSAAASDSGAGIVSLIADFEAHPSGTANVLFRQPSYSGTTGSFLDASPNSSAVTDSFPTNGNSSSRALAVSWSFKSGTTDPWLRLTTAAAASSANPTVHFKQQFYFSIHADKSIKVALGVRETGSSAAIGADGGTSGTIEFIGATNKSGNMPHAVRTVPANVWTNLMFDLPSEPLISFTGDGTLFSPTDKGVLEHIALVPASGAGTNNIFLDHFYMVQPNALTYSLDPGAPAGASIHPATGVFSWAAPQTGVTTTNSVTVRVTDNGSPPMSDTRTFNIILVAPPKSTTATVANNQAVLTWQTFPGKTYRVEYKNDLSAPSWTPLGSDTVAPGGTLSITNNVIGVMQRFYRLVQLN